MFAGSTIFAQATEDSNKSKETKRHPLETPLMSETPLGMPDMVGGSICHSPQSPTGHAETIVELRGRSAQTCPGAHPTVIQFWGKVLGTKV